MVGLVFEFVELFIKLTVFVLVLFAAVFVTGGWLVVAAIYLAAKKPVPRFPNLGLERTLRHLL